MTQRGFAGRVGSKNREPVPGLEIDTKALLGEAPATPEPTLPLAMQARRPRGGKKPVQADRLGKTQIGAHFDKNVKKQFAMLGIELDKSHQELLTEALNDLFKKYSKPTIA